MFENRYSFVDRLLHRLAFATTQTQIEFAEIENQRFEAEFGVVEAKRPVFVTGLPRAGTTLLLNVFARLSDFASHTYRDMPFILTPLTWSQFSTRYQKSDAQRERAHADGVMVSVDSAEAFDEIIWRAFWPNQYRSDRILTWPREGGDAFTRFFQRHMSKVAALHRRGADPAPRYLSKNNTNIARLDWLGKAFPDATVILPFREPLEHAASLLAQHLRFLDLHAQDRFMREYMAGVGHFDFGANLLPIDFDNWLGEPTESIPTGLGFWLKYWAAAYGHCLRRKREGVIFLDYDRLCERPERSLAGLARVLDIERQSLLDASSGVRKPRRREADVSMLSGALLSEANAIHAELCAVAERTGAEFALSH